MPLHVLYSALPGADPTSAVLAESPVHVEGILTLVCWSHSLLPHGARCRRPPAVCHIPALLLIFNFLLHLSGLWPEAVPLPDVWLTMIGLFLASCTAPLICKGLMMFSARGVQSLAVSLSPVTCRMLLQDLHLNLGC